MNSAPKLDTVDGKARLAFNGRVLMAGDIVTWRKAPRPGSSVTPLGITGCKIISFGESEDGKPAALIEAMGQEVAALAEDLHRETHHQIDK